MEIACWGKTSLKDEDDFCVCLFFEHFYVAVRIFRRKGVC